ncbi:hypothetical protein [Sphingobacterium chungjuense]|uniref:hypothetical protein n=1 Tax=Sphingobacterium chungjuense TaxID=2675553 RepID=UPI00140A9890|nr:hypothetical protein [Sphingobacterium chungjuense]
MHHHKIFDAIKSELLKYDHTSILNQYADYPHLDLEIFGTLGRHRREFTTSVEMINTLREHIMQSNLVLTEDQYYWIINIWGGIGSFKRSQKNTARISKFLYSLHSNRLTTDLFSVISSLSKIGSFSDAENYFVYDSRTVYTFNWLILKADIAEPRFFPMPDSRNAKLKLFDLNTIIALKYKDRILQIPNNYSITPLLFTRDQAYFTYCKLIKYLHQYVLIEQPIWTVEMLLFSMADHQIFKEVQGIKLV